MKITIWPNLGTPIGTERSLDWEKLATWMAAPVEFGGTFETKGWSAASFVCDQRSLKRAAVAYALCLDFDSTIDRAEIDRIFGSTKCLVHSSKSNREEDPRYRVTLALSRPVTAAEYELLWSGYTRPIAECVDQQTKDMSRFWYVPCRTPETKWEFWRHDGEPVDVDLVISTERELREKAERDAAEMRERARVLSERNRSTGGASLEDRASRYVAQMDASISGSRGHDKLWLVAIKLVRGFELPIDSCRRIIREEFNQRCLPPWSAKEIEHKLEQAQKAKCSTGWLLGGRSDPELPPCPDPDRFEEELEQPETSAPADPPVEIEDPPQERKSAAERYGVVSMRDLALTVLTDIDKPKKSAICITGVKDLDSAMGGMRESMITVIAARTSFGKTTFALRASLESKKLGANVLWLPFEDSSLLYGRRLVADLGFLNATALRDRDINYKERQRILQVAQETDAKPFLLNCIGKNVEWVCKAVRELAQEFKIDLVIADYVQRMHTEARSQDRRNEVTRAAEIMSDTIKTIGAAGILVSQLKRIEIGERPTMFDLKESGDLENCAEHIILGYSKEWLDRDEKRLSRRVFLDKNKDGPLVEEDIEVPFDEVSAAFRPNGVIRYESAEQRRVLEEMDNAIEERYG